MVLAMDPQLFQTYSLDQKKIASLVGHHYTPMRGIKALQKTQSHEEFNKTFAEFDNKLSSLTGGLTKDEVLLLFLADKLGQGKHVSDQKELLLAREAFIEKDYSRREELLQEIYYIQKQQFQKSA